MATISFIGDQSITLQAGSGIGFFGENFGSSIQVGAFNSRTFITNSNGTYQGAEIDNCKFLNSQSGILGTAGTGIHLLSFPNRQSTLQIHFNHSSAVKIQNAEVRIYDRNNINNDPSGLTCYTAEIIHPDITQTNNGSGDTAWINTHGSGVKLSLAPSPGVSGFTAGNGSNGGIADQNHDWHVAISASPDSIGSKVNFGLYCALEYY